MKEKDMSHVTSEKMVKLSEENKPRLNYFLNEIELSAKKGLNSVVLNNCILKPDVLSELYELGFFITVDGGFGKTNVSIFWSEELEERRKQEESKKNVNHIKP